MSDLFMILACLVLLTLTLAIAVNLNGSQPHNAEEGFSSQPVTAQIAYEEAEDKPTLTGSFDQKTNNTMRASPRTSQIMERAVNPQLET
jgi:flagellar basal body-associated protein FliL